jgi:hypothetical protein
MTVSRETIEEGVARNLLGADGAVTIVERRPDVHRASFPNEIIVCRLGDGREMGLFCKYSAHEDAVSHGHKAGVSYESAVYRDVLERSRERTPKYFGTWRDARGRTALVVEYLQGAEWVDVAKEPCAMESAAAWIGRFHAEGEERVRGEVPALTVYDASYFAGWVERTVGFARGLTVGGDWLDCLAARFSAVVPLLVGPRTIIHGEYYKKNVLFDDGQIYPVDWESAALGVGEIDLAALTEGRRPSEEVRACETAYSRARWGARPPQDFGRRLDAAQLYLQFRWLGDRHEWTTHARAEWRFRELRRLGERLGLLG